MNKLTIFAMAVLGLLLMLLQRVVYDDRDLLDITRYITALYGGFFGAAIFHAVVKPSRKNTNRNIRGE